MRNAFRKDNAGYRVKFCSMYQIAMALVLLIPMRRGRFVTGTTDADSNQIAWLSMFDMVELGSIGDLPPIEMIQSLKASGVRYVLLYDWMPAGYHYTDSTDDGPFMAWIYENRDTLTLNPAGPFPHCSLYGWCEDYYFDLALDTLRSRRVDYLMHIMDSMDYDGMFFDWGGGAFIDYDEYTFVRDTYYSRHPDYPYPRAVAEFYGELKAQSGRMVMTNQGFRNAEYILPEVDLDMTESYGVGEDYFGDSLYVEGMGYIEVPRTVYYPVSTTYPDGSIEDQIQYLKLLKGYYTTYSPDGFGGFVYMNYAAPRFVMTGDTVDGHPVFRMEKPLDAIYLGYAIAMLENFAVYTEVPFDHRYERDSIYFYDPGEPLDTGCSSPMEGVYVRYYSSGLIIVGEWQETTTVILSSPYIPPGIDAFDPYRGEWTTTGEHTIQIRIEPVPDPLTGRMAPSGRLILYDTDVARREKVEIPMRDYIRTEGGFLIAVSNGTLYSKSGRKIARMKSGEKVPMENLPPGVYIFRPEGKDFTVKVPVYR